MGNLHLVTGYAGQAHVTAADHGSLFAAAIRGDQFVTNAGKKFAALVVSNNLIRISDGELVMQGRHVKLDPGAYVDLTIENGAQGVSRVDLIVARYTRESSSGVEECNLAVIKGTPAGSNPATPSHTIADINAAGTLLTEMPLYTVHITGLTVGAPVAQFTPQAAVYEVVDNHVGDKNNPHGITPEQLGVIRKSGGAVDAGAIFEFLSDTKQGAKVTYVGNGLQIYCYADKTNENTRSSLKIEPETDTIFFNKTVDGATVWRPVIHAGNIAQYIGVAPATVE